MMSSSETLSRSETLMCQAVDLASSGMDLDAARRRLVDLADGDRTALEVARAVVMRDGLPRHRPTAPTVGRRRTGSLRNRTLNLIESALKQQPAGVAALDGDAQYRWNEVFFETWG
jgi:hypothetical protein